MRLGTVSDGGRSGVDRFGEEIVRRERAWKNRREHVKKKHSTNIEETEHEGLALDSM